MIRGERLFFFAHRHRTALGTHQDLVAGTVEVVHADFLLAATRGKQRRFVGQVGQVRTGEARGTARDHHRLDIVGQRQLAHVHLEDLLAALDVRQADYDLAIETARAQQRRIQHVRTVGGGDDDHALASLETVHFDQQLVQRLLALVMTAAETGATMATDGVDFIDEDDARGLLLGLLEHVAHAAGADADEHFHEVRTGDREERDLGLTRNGAGQQGLAGTRRADHQHAARDLAAQLGELGRVTQEVDQFANLFLGLVAAGDIGEGDLDLVFALQLGARLAEGHRALGPAATALHLAHDEDPEADDQDHREEVHQDRAQRDAAGRRRLLEFHLLAAQHVDQVAIVGRGDGAGLAAAGGVRHIIGTAAHFAQHYFLDVAAVHLVEELRIRRTLRAGSAALRREALEDHHQHDGDDHP